ncbi:MAG TPA: class I SAM-dependent methyltransferase [Bryobacteraceae bacterium]|nr:class I SAM-dependent methyltransferase [Bryobacteraceae bacterium]
MTISADLERDFYDASYAQFLNLPESDLVCTRQTLEADLANPAKPIYERRRLYSAIMQALLAEPVVGRAVLDYGCGTGDWGLMLAAEGASVTFLDLSPVAIQVTERRAAAGGVADRVRGVARDASDLSCFRDEEFDLIYGSAAVHHTLKYPGALEELLRVLRPGGRLVLAETYGNNQLLNVFRRLGWKLRGQADEQGEEIVFNDGHVRMLRERMAQVDVMPMNLLAMAKRLFRGRFERAAVRGAVGALEKIDGAVLSVAPALRRYCGEVVVVGRK